MSKQKIKLKNMQSTGVLQGGGRLCLCLKSSWVWWFSLRKTGGDNFRRYVTPSKLGSTALNRTALNISQLQTGFGSNGFAGGPIRTACASLQWIECGGWSLEIAQRLRRSAVDAKIAVCFRARSSSQLLTTVSAWRSSDRECPGRRWWSPCPPTLPSRRHSWSSRCASSCPRSSRTWRRQYLGRQKVKQKN